jgi:hypothetical protein
MSTTPFILAGVCRAALFVFSGQCGLIRAAFRWRVRSAFVWRGDEGLEFAGPVSDEFSGDSLPLKRVIGLAAPVCYGVGGPPSDCRDLTLGQLGVVGELGQTE